MEVIDLRTRTMRKVSRHFIPFMVAMFFVNFLDRVNIGFAALQMNRDLGLTPEVYGFAAGILFIPYALAEVPSNMILDKVGPRIWLARIMISWGIISCANAFVWDKHSLYLMRCLLGFAEAGFFPGLMVVLIRWFPTEERARAVTLFMLGNPISIIFGGPLSSQILSLDGVFGIAGWKYLLFLEGTPAVVLGVMALWWLTDDPKKARWLEPEEADWLTQRLAAEQQAKSRSNHSDRTKWVEVFRSGQVWALAFCKFCVLLSFFGITLWLPQIVKGMGTLSNVEVGLISAIPFIFSAIASILIGRSSDRTGERAKHIGVPALIGAVGFVIAGFSADPYVQLVGLCISATGVWVSNTIFWTVPAQLLSGSAAAIGIALINSVGNFGGFFGPYLTGAIVGATGSYAWALTALGAFLALNAVIILIIARPEPTVQPRLATN
jgi:ACS family tartrate transporter-like MFS transporter